MDKYKKLKLVEVNNDKIDLPKIIYDSRLQTKNHVDFLEKINYLYARNPTIKKKSTTNKQKKSFLLQSSNNNALDDDDDDDEIDDEDELYLNRRREKLLLEKKLKEKEEKYNKHKRMFERKVDIWSLKGNKRTSLFDNQYQTQTNNTIYTTSNNFINKNNSNGLYITYCDATVNNTCNNTKYNGTERLSRLGNTSSQMITNYTSLNRTENSKKKKKHVIINLYSNETKKICKNKIVNNCKLEKKLLVNKNQLNLRSKINSYNYNTIDSSNKDITYYKVSDLNSISNNINIDNTISTAYVNNDKDKDYADHTIDPSNDTTTPILDLKSKPIKLSKSKVRESLLKYQQLKKSNPNINMEELIDTKCQNVLDNLVDNFSLINNKSDKVIQIDDIINKLNKKQNLKEKNTDSNDLGQLEFIKKKKEEEKMITQFNEIVNNRDFFYKSDKLSSLNTKFAYDAQNVIKVLFNYYDSDSLKYRKRYKGDPNRNRNSLILKKLLEMNIREKSVCVKRLDNYQERDLKLKQMENNVLVKNEDVKVKKEFYY